MATQALNERSLEPSTFSDGERAVAREVVLRADTTDATKTTMYISDDSTNGKVLVPTGSTIAFSAIIAGRSDAGASGGYFIRGLIENKAGTTAIIGSNVADTPMEDTAGWAAVVEADDTNNAIAVGVTGASSANVNWTCLLTMVEVSNADA
jgi:hypothetical protein